MKDMDQLALLMSKRLSEGEEPYTLILGSLMTLPNESVIGAMGYSSRSEFFQSIRTLSNDERYAFLSNPIKNNGNARSYDSISSMLQLGQLDVVITTDIGNGLEESLMNIGVKPSQFFVFILGRDSETLDQLSLRSPRIKIVKIRGDLRSRILSNITPEEALKNNSLYQAKLQPFFDRDTIIVGVSPDDHDLESLIRVSKGSAWLVSPQAPDENRLISSVLSLRFNKQIIIEGENGYNKFWHGLVEKLDSDSDLSRSIPRKSNSDMLATPLLINDDTLQSNRNIKVLFLAANSLDTNRLRIDEEFRSIDQAIRQSDFGKRFEINQFWAVRTSDLQSCLLRSQPDIVHFSGHGNRSGQIMLENNNGQSHPVSAAALGQLFSLIKNRDGNNIRCVLLNACYSAKQANAIAKHVDCVIGSPNAISDLVAINFAMAFYQALGFGKDAKTAYNLGCSQIEIENLNPQEKPKFLSKLHKGNFPIYFL